MLAMRLQIYPLLLVFLQIDNFLLGCFVLAQLFLSHVTCSGSLPAAALRSDGGSFSLLHSLPDDNTYCRCSDSLLLVAELGGECFDPLV